jgi:hypothetical protein
MSGMVKTDINISAFGDMDIVHIIWYIYTYDIFQITKYKILSSL